MMTVDELKEEILKLSIKDQSNLMNKLGWVIRSDENQDTVLVTYDDGNINKLPTMTIEYISWMPPETEIEKRKTEALSKIPIFQLIEADINNLSHPFIKYCIKRWSAILNWKHYFKDTSISKTAEKNLKEVIKILQKIWFVNPKDYDIVRTMELSNLELTYLSEVSKLAKSLRKTNNLDKYLTPTQTIDLINKIENKLKQTFREDSKGFIEADHIKEYKDKTKWTDEDYAKVVKLIAHEYTSADWLVLTNVVKFLKEYFINNSFPGERSTLVWWKTAYLAWRFDMPLPETIKKYKRKTKNLSPSNLITPFGDVSYLYENDNLEPDETRSETAATEFLKYFTDPFISPNSPPNQEQPYRNQIFFINKTTLEKIIKHPPNY